MKAALSRSKFHDGLDEGWASVLKLHYGAVALTEYQACQFQARMVRFGPSPSMRNMATYGMLDELRHAQLHCSSRTNYCRETASMIGRMKRRIQKTGRFSAAVTPWTIS